LLWNKILSFFIPGGMMSVNGAWAEQDDLRAIRSKFKPTRNPCRTQEKCVKEINSPAQAAMDSGSQKTVPGMTVREGLRLWALNPKLQSQSNLAGIYITLAPRL
jgi:hypothetical protein